MKKIHIWGAVMMASFLGCAQCEDVTQFVSENVWDADNALLESVMFGKPNLTSILADSNVMNVVSGEGYNFALVRAVRDQKISDLKAMVEDDRFVRGIKSFGQNEAFMWAAYGGYNKMVKLFIDNPKINELLTSIDASVALWGACAYDHVSTLQEMLSNSEFCKLLDSEIINKAVGLTVYSQYDLVLQELLGNEVVLSMITRKNADRILKWASALGNLKMVKMMFANFDFCQKLSPEGLEKALDYAKTDEVKTLLFYKSWRGMRNGDVLSENKQELLSRIVTGDGKPSEALVKILEKIDLKHNGTMADIAEKMQQFRLNSYDETLFVDKFDELRSLFQELGMVDSFEYHSQNNYKYAIVSCGWVDAVQSRLSYLAKWWNDGVRFEKIVFLVVDKDLNPVNDSVEFMKRPYCKHLPFKKDWKFDESMPYKTYLDMMKLVWNALDFPVEMGDLPVEFVMVSDWDTGLALKNWLSTCNPEPGDILFVGNQPYCAAGLVCARNVLPADFKEIDFVGYAIHPRFECVSFWLGALAWWLNEAYLVPQK